MSISRILKGLFGLAAVLLVAGAVWAWHPAWAPVAAPAASSFPPAQVAEGARLAAAGNCAACHYSGAPKPPAMHGSLALSSALTSDDPANFIQTVLHGAGGAGLPGPYMPGFADALTNADIATLGAYMRRTRTDLSAWVNLPEAVAARRPEAAATTPSSVTNSTPTNTSTSAPTGAATATP